MEMEILNSPLPHFLTFSFFSSSFHSCPVLQRIRTLDHIFLNESYYAKQINALSGFQNQDSSAKFAIEVALEH
jgi:hypothetical protein